MKLVTPLFILAVTLEKSTNGLRLGDTRELRDDNDDFAFLVSGIDPNNPWCLTAKETRQTGNLGFLPCDLDDEPKNQLWKLDDEGRLHSRVDPNDRCMVVGYGTTLFDGVRMRLGTCDKPKVEELNQFMWDGRYTNYLIVGKEEGFNQGANYYPDLTQDTYCITNRGPKPDKSDVIHAKPCWQQDSEQDRLDYRWYYFVPGSADQCQDVATNGNTCRVQMLDNLNSPDTLINLEAKDDGDGKFVVTDRVGTDDEWDVDVEVKDWGELVIDAGVPDVNCTRLMLHYVMKDDSQLTFTYDPTCTDFGKNIIFFLIEEWFYFG